jgi:3-hydroxyacyl-CoA dehydrogenase/enoyl-CoA hydratase/3-hydroxybutyryl-CoA epimerase
MQYINGYPHRDDAEVVGPAAFVQRARELAAKYGERFEPPASLVAKAEAGETYSDSAVAVTA